MCLTDQIVKEAKFWGKVDSSYLMNGLDATLKDNIKEKKKKTPSVTKFSVGVKASRARPFSDI